MDFKKIRHHCESSSSISKVLVDDYLIHYCNENERLDKKVVQRLAAFRDLVKKMPEEWVNWITSQYIAHKIFRKNGLLQKYLNRNLFEKRSLVEIKWLNFQLEHPWRFSFFSIRNNPSPEFFTMHDELSDEDIFLRSQGIQSIIDQHGQMKMFFLLVGFNGECWETYGPLTYLRGMQAFDLLYFSRHLDPKIDFINSIPDLIDMDPIPFMLLYRGGEVPLTAHDKDLIIFNNSEYHEPDFKPETYSEQFEITKRYPIYKMQLREWDKHPHFSTIYYHAKKNRLILSAMTDKGYTRIVDILEKSGYHVPHTPDIRATMAMICTAKEIFKTDLELVPYAKTFSQPVSPAQEKELEKINAFIKSYLPVHNSGGKFNLHDLASKAGIDDELAKQVVEQIQKTSNRMLDKNDIAQ